MAEPVIPILAQRVLDDIISKVHSGVLLHSALGDALAILVNGLPVDRGLIWQIDGGRLAITHQFSEEDNQPNLIGLQLDPMESTAIVLHFLSRFPDASERSIIDVRKDSDPDDDWAPFWKTSQQYHSNLLVQLRSDIFSGFFVYQTRDARRWSSEELTTVAKVGALVSVLIKDCFQIQRLKMEASGFNTLLKILEQLFKQNKPLSESGAIAVNLIAGELGFNQSKLYLHSGEALMPAGRSGGESLDLRDQQDPFVQVFTSGLSIRFGETERTTIEKYFHHHSGIIFPLRTHEKSFGVFAVWERSREWSFSDRYLTAWFPEELSKWLAPTRT